MMKSTPLTTHQYSYIHIQKLIQQALKTKKPILGLVKLRNMEGIMTDALFQLLAFAIAIAYFKYSYS